MAEQEIKRIEIDSQSAQSSFFDAGGSFVIGDPIQVVKRRLYDIEGGLPVSDERVRERWEFEMEIDESNRLEREGRKMLEDFEESLDK